MTVFATIELVLAANGPYDVVCVEYSLVFGIRIFPDQRLHTISTYTDATRSESTFFVQIKTT